MLERFLFVPGLCIVLGAAAWAMSIEGEVSEEVSVNFNDAPKEVQSAITKVVGKAKIDKLEVEVENGITIYEAEWMVDGVEHEVSVSEAGDILETEKVVASELVPPGVLQAAQKHMPEGGEPEFEMKSVILYSVETEVNGKEVEILVDPTGRLMELETKNGR